jgi:hypothetical protein
LPNWTLLGDNVGETLSFVVGRLDLGDKMGDGFFSDFEMT